ncbi:MAG: GlsB/YeaQ/YmgE family stress response membrane protein [Alphaproteobacteria bacterium]|nr:MAG: GlsB/YeaQ/YmgE family stress response membrane protein [Alphaproteobacteria bacterium]
MAIETAQIMLIGFILGLIAHFLKPDENRMNLLFSILIGIIGALLGKFTGVVMGIYHPEETAAYFGAIAGAAIMLAILSFINTGSITHQR